LKYIWWGSSPPFVSKKKHCKLSSSAENAAAGTFFLNEEDCLEKAGILLLSVKWSIVLVRAELIEAASFSCFDPYVLVRQITHLIRQ
jgi:hypothetical protein